MKVGAIGDELFRSMTDSGREYRVADFSQWLKVSWRSVGDQLKISILEMEISDKLKTQPRLNSGVPPC
jgi:hypothetical protein